MTTDSASRKNGALLSRGTIIFSCLTIAIFYFFSVGSSLVTALGQDQTLAFLLAPFDVATSVAYIRSLSSQRAALSTSDETLLRLFHSRDPEVIAKLAEYFYAVDNREKATHLASLAILYDRFRLEYYKVYVKIQRQKWEHPVLEEAYLLSQVYIPKEFQERVSIVYGSMLAIKPIDGEHDMPSLDNASIVEGQIRPYLARAYYLLGFFVLDKDLILTNMFWELAAEIKPNLSYYAAERASLLWFGFGDYKGAIEALQECERDAVQHCQELLGEATKDPPIFFPIGYFKQQIMDASLL